MTLFDKKPPYHYVFAGRRGDEAIAIADALSLEP